MSKQQREIREECGPEALHLAAMGAPLDLTLPPASSLLNYLRVVLTSIFCSHCWHIRSLKGLRTR